MLICGVSSSCYNKMHRLRGLNNKYLFLKVLETGKFILYLERAWFLDHAWLSFHCVLKWGRKGERAFWNPLYKGTNSCGFHLQSPHA